MGAQPEGSTALNIKLPRSEWDSYVEYSCGRGTHPTTVIKDRIMDGLTLVERGIAPPLLHEVEDYVTTTDPKSGKPIRRNVGMVTKPYWLPDEHAARVKAVAERTGWTDVRTSRSLMHLGEQAAREHEKAIDRLARKAEKAGAR